MATRPHRLNPLALDLGSEQRTEPVPPGPHHLVADLDAAVVGQVLDVAQ